MRSRICLRLILPVCAACLVLTISAISSAQVIKSGPPTCPGIALTFDLCPVSKGSGYDRSVVDYLTQHQIPATFFMSGKWMKKHDEEVEHLLGIGFFEIGTHGDAHKHLPLHSAEEQREEIYRPVEVLHEHYAHDATLFRPPYGEYNDVTVDIVNALGLRFIHWSIESGDPDPALSTERILARVAKRVKPGSIIVFHANGKGKQTRQVIERLTIEVLPHKGLKPMTVSELLKCTPPTP